MLNYVVIQGKMCRDVETRSSASGKPFATFCIAVQRNYKNSQGKYDADFIDCIAYDKMGEFVGKYFHKGDSIIVSGELQTSTYTDKNGSKHKPTVINVSKAFFSGESKGSSNPASTEPTEVEETSEVGELPFEQ